MTLRRAQLALTFTAASAFVLGSPVVPDARAQQNPSYESQGSMNASPVKRTSAGVVAEKVVRAKANRRLAAAATTTQTSQFGLSGCAFALSTTFNPAPPLVGTTLWISHKLTLTKGNIPTGSLAGGCAIPSGSLFVTSEINSVPNTWNPPIACPASYPNPLINKPSTVVAQQCFPPTATSYYERHYRTRSFAASGNNALPANWTVTWKTQATVASNPPLHPTSPDFSIGSCVYAREDALFAPGTGYYNGGYADQASSPNWNFLKQCASARPRKCVMPFNSLKAWWRFENNGNDHLGSSSLATNSSQPWGVGARGNALNTSSGGITQPMTAPINTALDIGAREKFTIDFWINVPAAVGASENFVIYKVRNNNITLIRIFIRDGKIVANIAGTETETKSLRGMGWKFVAITHVRNKPKPHGLKIYVGDADPAGVLTEVANNHTMHPLLWGVSPIEVGESLNGTKGIQLDELEIFDTELQSSALDQIRRAPEGKCF